MNNMCKKTDYCLSGCLYYKDKDKFEKKEIKDNDGNILAYTNEFVGKQYYCAVNSPYFMDWMNRNDNCTNYKPLEFVSNLKELNNIAEKILERIKTQKDGK